jgi:hypothetical protein
MLTATFRTSPTPYSKTCDTFRSRIGQSATIRAGLGSKTFIDLFKPCAMLNSLVRQLISKCRPSCIKYGLSHFCLGKPRSTDISNRNVIKLPNNPAGKFVVKITSTIFDFVMYCCNTPLLTRSLSNCKCRFSCAVKPFSFNFFTSGQCGKVFKTKVNANAFNWLASTFSSLLNINNDVQKPVSTRIPRKISTVFNLAFRQWSAVKYAKGVTSKAESVAFSLQLTTLKRNPSRRFLATVSKIRSLLLTARCGVLLTDCVNILSYKKITSQHK